MNFLSIFRRARDRKREEREGKREKEREREREREREKELPLCLGLFSGGAEEVEEVNAEDTLGATLSFKSPVVLLLSLTSFVILIESLRVCFFFSILLTLVVLYNAILI